MVNFMALSMKQNQQQRQKLTQEQSFFLDILKFDKEELMDYLEKEKKPGDIILLMGAGNIRQTSEQLCAMLEEKE